MKEKELIKAIREIYKLWNENNKQSKEDIEFILNQIILKIGEK